MAELQVGSPWEEATAVGPLIRPEHRAWVEGYVERAADSGATIETGGGHHPIARRFFMNPVLVGNAANDAVTASEELLGPVGVVIPYDTVDEAVAAANDSRSGLGQAQVGWTAYFTEDGRRRRPVDRVAVVGVQVLDGEAVIAVNFATPASR